jgi:NAD(P)-dependent dehydrogenase (short-subunit alcohol dehydrogenase family)
MIAATSESGSEAVTLMEETVEGNLVSGERGQENGVARGATGVALVTGAFSGIGLASAHALREAGFQVYATGRDITKAPRELRRVIPGKPPVTILELDVRDAESVRAAFAFVAATSGRLDVLVNNAGYGLFGAVASGTDEQIQRQLDTNVVGVIRATRAALPVMMLHRRGRIINIGTAAGHVALPGMGSYAASKFALVGLTDALALELMLLGPDFHVTIIEPAQVQTSFVDQAVYAPDGGTTAESFPGFTEHFKAFYRAGNAKAPGPSTVARAVVKAATDARPKARHVVGGRARLLLAEHALLPRRLMRRILFRAFGMGKIAAPGYGR